ncbi:sugar ABC transporter permease [Agrococcus sp. SL85]|uniref:sugar ABC transporter permease n=1 Tax=Agrococcus sp. SL85 TaxID=2995141 RepID=UPI00226CAF4A|nr:sugar ABC transporter permease [Agrococcus sp. SL85]WAC67463.1 sugar ABC transporter permease [Agrococcus sp. SL85]
MREGAPPLRTIRQPRMGFGRWMRELGWRHVIGVAVVIFATFPIIYVISASLNPNGTLTGSNQLFQSVSGQNYVDLFSDPRRPFANWFANTMIVGIVTSVGTVFLGALAAYAFSRMRFAGRRGGLLSLILVQMFPQLLAVVAIYLLMRGISEIFPAIGLDSLIGLIMVYLGGALGVNTYLMYGFFNTVPSSIDEAAKLDGAGHARIFFTIILRLVAPILAVVGLLSFIGTTSEFVIASTLMTSPENLTLAVGLFRYVSEETNSNYPIFAAGAVLSAIPVVALFLYLQKYIVGGLTAGAVK